MQALDIAHVVDEPDGLLNGTLIGAGAGLVVALLVSEVFSGYVDGETDPDAWDDAKGYAVAGVPGAAIGFSIDAAWD